MKIYTHYSNTHQELYNNFFLKSLRNVYSKKELPVRALNHEQTTENGTFMEPGWLEAMNFKILVVLKAIEECKGGWFIFADCDINFYQPFLKDLEQEIRNKDIICQQDRGTLCAGFFACKANEKNKALWSQIKSTFRSFPGSGDQTALNYFKDQVDYGLLDKEKYYSVGNFPEGTNNLTTVWDNKTNIVPPKNILLHHANYVVGTKNKIALLEMIRKNIQK